ncbi:MAG: hypothetical protein V2B18_03145 [Pseudomonadota bacterium]
MPKTKGNGPTWSDVKSVLAGMDRNQLVQLAGDLYRLSKDNRDFFHVRFAVAKDPLEPYKKTIEQCMYPNVLRDKPIQIVKAKTAVIAYSKAGGDPLGEAELMTFFVECGNSFTIHYGDINEEFYYALNLMYSRAIEKVLGLPPEQQGEFRERLKDIMTSADGIGWGYYDELRSDFYKAFSDEKEG